jgi:hypothetical protein
MGFVEVWDWAGRFSVAGLVLGFVIAVVMRLAGFARVHVQYDSNGRRSLLIRRPDPLLWSGGWAVVGAIVGVVYGFLVR